MSGNFLMKQIANLRENERRMLLLNEQALLIPGLHLPVLPSSIREESDFERNGSSSISLPARTDALTPMQITKPDLLVVGSPLNESASEFTDDSSCTSFLPGIRSRTKRIIYTDTDSDSERTPDPPSNWVERDIKLSLIHI